MPSPYCCCLCTVLISSAEHSLCQVVPVEAGQLSTTQESVFKSAQQALSVLPQGMHRIRSIVPAKELPVTMNSSNAFSESYNFDAASGRLAIRAERLSSVGEMMTILAHANAHIQCGSMDSDQVRRGLPACSLCMSCVV